MTIVSYPEAIKLGFARYGDFTGRSTRAEYWWWVLFLVLADGLLTVVDMGIGTYNTQSDLGLLSGLFGLSTLIPSFALGARRLHDINKSGWWQLMWFGFFLLVPIIVLIVWTIRQGDNGTNTYGPDSRQLNKRE